MTSLEPTAQEITRRAEVIAAIREAVTNDMTIKLPPLSTQAVPSRYGGQVGGYAYQFEGEEDLLHLSVARQGGGTLTAEEGQAVASFLLEGMPPGLVWIRPGKSSQHFFFGHDDLVQHVL
jgi:hypothetical protein